MSAPRRPKPGHLSRRNFLRRTGYGLPGALTAGGLAACSGSDQAPEGSGPAFRHGVASGDPGSDRVMCWTRVSDVEADTPVTLRLFSDPELSNPVASFPGTARATRDFTVKIDADGLEPGTTYYYRFEAAGETSATGRTRTAPLGGIERLRFGVVSCSSYAHGHFNAYRRLAERADVDAILHLGDYIYEYGTGEYGDVRPYQPDHEMVTLEDYRTRHAWYKQDPDLMELHRQFPFITTWDDHESTDNSWRDGAVNHTEGAEGVWTQRKAWAQQAYDEWMPIRYPETGRVDKIFRSFRYGDLAEIFVLDTRLYDRDEPDGIPASSVAAEPDRRMLGPEQMNWLLAGLGSSSARWKIVAQQMVFMQWQVTADPSGSGNATYLNGDAWDGYQAERAQIHAHLRDNALDNVVILSGDVHSSWVGDIVENPSNPLAYNPATGAGSLATEFTTTSITSPFAIQVPDGEDAFRAANPHIRYVDTIDWGYLLLDLDTARAQGEYWYVDTITEPGGGERFETAYAVESGTNTLSQLPVPASEPPADPPPLAP